MDRRVFRISVMGGQIFREILRPPPVCFAPFPEYLLPSQKVRLISRKAQTNLPSLSFFVPPPVFYLPNKPFWFVKGLQIFFRGGGQDSLLEGSRFPCYAPVNGECIFQTHKKEKSPAYLYFLN